MCYGCWVEYGKPAMDTPQIRAAAALIGEVYEYHGVGGYLHIVIDDWNLEDDHLEYCLQAIEKNEWDNEENEALEIQRKCCDALMKLTELERGAALAMHEGFTN